MKSSCRAKRKTKMHSAVVIGGGFAGVEAAWQLAQAGIAVTLYEMKPGRFSAAHTLPTLAEPVCSNSFKAERLASAAGLLKAEMERFGSLCVRCAKQTQVPAGGALAVDRTAFSALVTREIEAQPLITVCREEITKIPQEGLVIVAAGPLASDALSADILRFTGGALRFYDAAAPIVLADSIAMQRAFYQSRYDRGEKTDYINCPLTQAEYTAFYEALISAKQAPLHEADREQKVYEGCMPVEALAARGADTLRFGPMKPVGLTDPKTGTRPYAVLQLRLETAARTMYNLVGFQTNLLFGEQQRVFGLIPALQNAVYVRFGVMHRNTYIDSPRLLRHTLQTKLRDTLYFAGQITGTEGYMESAAGGILAGYYAARQLQGKPAAALPGETMLGALSAYVSDPSVTNFQPMGANFGLLPPLDEKIRVKQERYAALAARSLGALDSWLSAQK